MSELFGRKVEVVTDKRRFSGDDFTIYFDVPFDDGADPNVSSIDIYNLKNQTINELKKGIKVTLNAGYANDVGAIFTGNIQQPQTESRTVDRVTSLDCIDSGETWFKKEISKTYKAGIKGQQILNDLVAQTGLIVGSFKLPTNKVYKSGKTIKGKLAQVIAEVAKDCGAMVHVNKGKIYIRKQGEGDILKFVLDKNTGLIGSPTQIEKEEKYNVVEKVKVTKKDKAGKTVTTYTNKKVEKKRTKRGWKIVSLLNHRITTNSIIEVKSKTANGTFRVEKGRHVSSGSKFYTEIEVY